MLLSNLNLSVKTWSSLCFPPVKNKNIKKKNNKNNPHQILQLLLTKFWPNFKGCFLGPYLTDANCHGAICSGNICPGNICPYRHNLSCYWPNFDQTSFWHPNCLKQSFFSDPNILLPNFFFLNRNCFGPLFWDPQFFCRSTIFLFKVNTFKFK